MSYKCEVTGKTRMSGNNVPFSLKRTKKSFKPNLQSKTVVIDGKKTKLKVSAAGIRTLKKQGVILNSQRRDLES